MRLKHCVEFSLGYILKMKLQEKKIKYNQATVGLQMQGSFRQLLTFTMHKEIHSLCLVPQTACEQVHGSQLETATACTWLKKATESIPLARGWLNCLGSAFNRHSAHWRGKQIQIYLLQAQVTKPQEKTENIKLWRTHTGIRRAEEKQGMSFPNGTKGGVLTSIRKNN